MDNIFSISRFEALSISGGASSSAMVTACSWVPPIRRVFCHLSPPTPATTLSPKTLMSMLLSLPPFLSARLSLLTADVFVWEVVHRRRFGTMYSPANNTDSSNPWSPFSSRLGCAVADITLFSSTSKSSGKVSSTFCPRTYAKGSTSSLLHISCVPAIWNGQSEIEVRI